MNCSEDEVARRDIDVRLNWRRRMWIHRGRILLPSELWSSCELVFYHHSSPDYIPHKLKYPPFLLQVKNEVHWEIMRGRKFSPFQNKFAPQYILWNRQGWKCQDKGWNNLHTYTLKFAISDSKVNHFVKYFQNTFDKKEEREQISTSE